MKLEFKMEEFVDIHILRFISKEVDQLTHPPDHPDLPRIIINVFRKLMCNWSNMIDIETSKPPATSEITSFDIFYLF